MRIRLNKILSWQLLTDTPGNVECEHVAKDGSDEKSRFERFAPIVPWHNCWHRETQSQHQRNVKPLE